MTFSEISSWLKCGSNQGGSECHYFEILLSRGFLTDSADNGWRAEVIVPVPSVRSAARTGQSEYTWPFPLVSECIPPASELSVWQGCRGDLHFYVPSVHTCLFLSTSCNPSRGSSFSSVITVLFVFRVAFVMKKHLNTHLLGRHGVGTPKER